MMKKNLVFCLLAFLVMQSCSVAPLNPGGTVKYWSNKPDAELVTLAASLPGLTLTEAPRDSSWLTQLKGSSAPDLMFVDLAADVATAAKGGLLADLGGYRGRLTSQPNQWPGLGRLVDAEQRPYFLPATVYLWRLFYHSEVLEKAGVKPPATLPELEAAFETLHSRGVVPLALGSSFGWPALAWVSVLDLQYNGEDAHRSLILGKRKFDDPSLQTVYATLARWRDKGWVDPDSGTLNWPEAVAKLAEGSAGFSLQPSSVVNRLRGLTAVRQMAVPGQPGRNEKTQLAGVQGFVVNAKAASVEAALALADAYLAQGVPGQVADLYRLPAGKSLGTDEAGSIREAQVLSLKDGAPVVVQLDRILDPQAAYDLNQAMILFFAKGSTMTAADIAGKLAAAVKVVP